MNGPRSLASLLFNVFFCLASACGAIAQAASIGYSITSIGGDSWRYDYTLANPSGGPSFDEITVYFDLPQSLEILSFSAPAGWDGLLVQVDPLLPASGYVDAVNLAGPVAAGSTTPGFSVDFRYAAGATPAQQQFELATSSPFLVVASGTTIPVPEPGSWALILSGLAVVSIVAGQRRGRHDRRASPRTALQRDL